MAIRRRRWRGLMAGSWSMTGRGRGKARTNALAASEAHGSRWFVESTEHGCVMHAICPSPQVILASRPDAASTPASSDTMEGSHPSIQAFACKRGNLFGLNRAPAGVARRSRSPWGTLKKVKKGTEAVKAAYLPPRNFRRLVRSSAIRRERKRNSPSAPRPPTRRAHRSIARTAPRCSWCCRRRWPHPVLSSTGGGRA